MGKYTVSDETKAVDFISWMHRQFESMSNKCSEAVQHNIFMENVYPRVLPYLEYLSGQDSLLVRTKEPNTYLSLSVGSYVAKVPNFSWRGSSYLEYPFKSERDLFDQLMRTNKNVVKIPDLYLHITSKHYFNRRQTAKVFLLNFYEFKPLANITCTIPKVSASNWYRTGMLASIDKDRLKEMQAELQSTISLMLL